MRSARGILFAQRLIELTSQLSELEDLRDRVENAERRVRRSMPGPRLVRPASRCREAHGQPRRFAFLAARQGVGTKMQLPHAANENRIEWSWLEPFPSEWWASP
jgi:hypothetical protein